jgi:hypothetical protein
VPTNVDIEQIGRRKNGGTFDDDDDADTAVAHGGDDDNAEHDAVATRSTSTMRSMRGGRGAARVARAGGTLRYAANRPTRFLFLLTNIGSRMNDRSIMPH